MTPLFLSSYLHVSIVTTALVVILFSFEEYGARPVRKFSSESAERRASTLTVTRTTSGYTVACDLVEYRAEPLFTRHKSHPFVSSRVRTNGPRGYATAETEGESDNDNVNDFETTPE